MWCHYYLLNVRFESMFVRMHGIMVSRCSASYMYVVYVGRYVCMCMCMYVCLQMYYVFHTYMYNISVSLRMNDHITQ